MDENLQLNGELCSFFGISILPNYEKGFLRFGLAGVGFGEKAFYGFGVQGLGLGFEAFDQNQVENRTKNDMDTGVCRMYRS